MNEELLDLRKVPCPMNAAKALIKIATMDMGELLEIWIDAGEPMENVPPAIQEEGHELVKTAQIDEQSWSLVIRVGR